MRDKVKNLYQNLIKLKFYSNTIHFNLNKEIKKKNSTMNFTNFYFL